MKLYDLKVANKDVYGKTHWRTIGTVFAGDDGSLTRVNPNKLDRDGNPMTVPVGFVIDFPQAQGIIVPRPLRPVNSEEPMPQTDESEDCPV